MEARIKWVENAAFIGTTGSGHGIVIDGPPDIGGKNLGMRPMELMLLSVAACSGVDVVHILKKGRHAVADVQVEVKGERAETEPKVFTRIHLHFIVSGRAIMYQKSAFGGASVGRDFSPARAARNRASPRRRRGPA